MEHVWIPELTERELGCIGTFVTQWGAMEQELLAQAMLSYMNTGEEIPKKLNGIQLEETLNHWNERVVEVAPDDIKSVLEAQLDEIKGLIDVRNAIIHGSWNWPSDNPSDIVSERIKHKNIHSFRGTYDDLSKHNLHLAKINFCIRHPSGPDALYRELAESGRYASREFRKAAKGDPTAYEDILKQSKVTD